MSTKKLMVGVLIVVFFILPIPISSHVPVSSEKNSKLARAEEIEDPTKSWAIYGNLENPDLTNYYFADLKSGEVLFLSLSKAIRDSNDNFIPKIYIFGEEFTNSTSLSSELEIPSNYGWIEIFPDSSPQKEFEPFGPSSFYSLLEFEYEIPNSNRYYIVITSANGGHYLLAVGTSESFTLSEWISTPVQMISVYRWEGQSWFLILIPWLFSIVLMFYLLFIRNFRGFNDLENWKKSIILLSSSFYASSAQYYYQTIISLYHGGPNFGLILSLFIGLLPVILGLLLFQILAPIQDYNLITLLKTILLSVMAIICWAGYIIFPVIMIVLSAYFYIINIIKSRDHNL